MATPRVINEISHDTRATLQHTHSRGGYKEIVRDGTGVVTSVIIWTSAAKLLKIRESILTRTLGQLTRVVKKQYDRDGNLVETFTQEFDRNPTTHKLIDVRLEATLAMGGNGGIPGSGSSALQILSGGVLLGTAASLDFEGATVELDAGVATITTGAGGGASSTFTGICLSSLAVGDLVYAAGASRTVALADPAVSGKTPVIGIVTSKPTPTSCVVQISGIVAGLSGLTPGYQLFLGLDGRLTSTPPTPGGGQTFVIQSLGVAIDAVSMLFSPTFITTHIRG